LDYSPYIIDPELERIMEAEFTVENRYIEFNIPVFVISPKGGFYNSTAVKGSFKKIVRSFRQRGYLPFLRKEGGSFVIRILKRLPASKPRYSLNLFLFAATLVTIAYDGYMRCSISIFAKELMPSTSVYINTLLYVISIVAIFGLHELAHKIVSMREGIEASMPYFIPAPPGFGGTFGAVITQKEPATNRDELFDLGLSGPLLGFLATLIITIFGVSQSFIVPISKLREWAVKYPEVGFQPLPTPPLIDFLIPIVKPFSQRTEVLIFHPVAFAGWVGCLISFLNLIPIWQLDGGHVSRAVFGADKHRILSYLGLVVMLFSGFYAMAILLALFMVRSKQDVPPLDDISPLSTNRKIFSLVCLGIMALTFIVLTPLL